jgi:hypothetical protein
VTRPLPPPLPPAERTVGQLIAEAMRFYGRRFWRVLPLGAPFALLDQLELGRAAGSTRVAVFALAAPVLAATYAAASALVAPGPVDKRAFAVAVLAGTLVLLPAAVLIFWIAVLAVAYLALVGLVVPVAVIEKRGVLDAFRRAGELARADYVHALGSLAALAIVFFIARLGLVGLLRGQADNQVRIAVFLADLVLAPLLFIGAALVYFDQAARVVHSASRTKRRTNADLHPAVDADRPGSPDAEVQS